MSFLRWVDRHLWSLPLLVFLLVELAFGVWAAVSSKPVLLAAAPLAGRQAVYSSLAGSSSALLGLAVAAVAIIAAFGPRPAGPGTPSRRELRLARARTIIAGSLLASSFFLLVVMITATVALAVDVRHTGNGAITTLIETSGSACVVGLVVGGLGLALIIVERSRS
jgi:hypothetical protein